MLTEEEITVIYPSFEQVRTLAILCHDSHLLFHVFRHGNAFSSVSEIYHHPYSFLLESAGERETKIPLLFIGKAPFLRVTARNGVLEIWDAAHTVQRRISHNPFQELSRLLRQFQAPHYSGYPPFLVGAVGYVGYEAIRYLNSDLSTMMRGDQEVDDFHFLFYDRLWVYDHLKQEVLIVAGLHVPRFSDEGELR